VPIEQQPPEVLALVVADHVHRDDMTGKYFILGTRFIIGAREFPWRHPALAVYAVLTDGRGETEVQVRLVDQDEESEPVFESEIAVRFSDPTTDVEVVFFLNDLVFPAPGWYRLRLYGAGQFLCERSILIMPLENPDEP
jgi:hypothetical protein